MAARQRLGAAVIVSTVIALAGCSSSGGATAGDGSGVDSSTTAALSSSPAAGPSSAPASGSGVAAGGLEGTYTTTFTFNLQGEMALTGSALMRRPGTCAHEGSRDPQIWNYYGKVGAHEVHLLASAGDMPGSYDLSHVGDAGVSIDGTSWVGKGHVTGRPDGTGSLRLDNLGSVTGQGRVGGTVTWTCKDN